MVVWSAFSHCKGSSAFFHRIDQSYKSDNLEYRTSHGVSDMSLRAQPHLYVRLCLFTELITLPRNAICI
jgi:hypothetical protein